MAALAFNSLEIMVKLWVISKFDLERAPAVKTLVTIKRLSCQKTQHDIPMEKGLCFLSLTSNAFKLVFNSKDVI